MNKIYKKIVAYNPVNNTVSFIHLLTYEQATDGKASDDAFYDVYNRVDHRQEIIVGVSICGNYYQLSPAVYGTYIKENESSMRFINIGRMLCAITKYHEEKHLPYSLFED